MVSILVTTFDIFLVSNYPKMALSEMLVHTYGHY